MHNTHAAAMVHHIRLTAPFMDLKLHGETAQDDLWTIQTMVHLELRLPLYHLKLGKLPPKPAAIEEARQSALALIAAYALAHEVRQMVVKIKDGEPVSISAQPRPHGLNWVKKHGMSPHELLDDESDPFLAEGRGSTVGEHLSTRDMLVIIAKASALICGGINPSREPHHGLSGIFLEGHDGTLTYEFERSEGNTPCARVIFRHLRPNLPSTVLHLRHP